MILLLEASPARASPGRIGSRPRRRWSSRRAQAVASQVELRPESASQRPSPAGAIELGTAGRSLAGSRARGHPNRLRFSCRGGIGYGRSLSRSEGGEQDRDPALPD